MITKSQLQAGFKFTYRSDIIYLCNEPQDYG